jgi:YjbE family integral membrane protein
MIDFDQILAVLTVIGIDIALSADNAIVIGLSAANLPQNKQKSAIAYGTLASALMRMVLAVFAVRLLGIVGLILSGGLLLLYVSWKLWWEIKGHDNQQSDSNDASSAPQSGTPNCNRKIFVRAIINIVLADLSMSIDNTLAVAGAARHHLGIMIFGLSFSILMTGLAATVIVKIMERHRWISYLGVALIFWVSLDMIWEGGLEVLNKLSPP